MWGDKASGLLFSVFCTLLLSGQPAAAVEYQTGLNFGDDSVYDAVPLALTPMGGPLPIRQDLSSDFPRPGDQGHQGSCVGWAVAYALKSYQEKVEHNWSLDSNERLFSPSFIYNQIKAPGSCLNGSNIDDALNLLTTVGVLPLAKFEYDPKSCSSVPDNADRQAAASFRIASFRKVNSRDVNEVRAQVAFGFPVIIGMLVDNAFMQLKAGEIYNSPDYVRPGGHAMVVIGYDDTKNAFKVINSWGENWGDEGYGWIDYSTFRELVRRAYVTQDIVARVPQPIEPRPSEMLGWAYFGSYDLDKREWSERYFGIPGVKDRAPKVGDRIVALGSVNIRQEPIRFVEGEGWVQSRSLATTTFGGVFEVRDVREVAPGFYWMELSTDQSAGN